MEKTEIYSIVGLLLFFLILAVLIFFFAAYLVHMHELTIQSCIRESRVWVQGTCPLNS